MLRWLALRKKEQYGLEVDVEVRNEIQVPEHNLRVLLYQVLREVLFNIVKHAGVLQARITTWSEASEVLVQVDDDGAGFDATSLDMQRPLQGGSGLLRVQERLRLVGGRFLLDTNPDEGTRVTLVIPIKEKKH